MAKQATAEPAEPAVVPVDGGEAGRIDRLHDAAERRLSKVGQRHTRQRRAILELVVDAGRPVTVPDLLAIGGAGVSQSSLYRNLVVLEDVGVLQRVAGWGNHDRFELSEALSGHHHHHMKCTSCGLVVDIPTNHGFEKAMAAESHKVSNELGFEVTGHSVDLFGRCSDCH
ncbi:Fur family transcriptional regulator [Desertimonas flava]|uniref:Fur family transcriptional regulator n=1 Tax=Desertimonas flava TaxID=2064846 RepID=UPI0013C42AE4|nr:Fur family transcriptional regulator [Desertimonas flava]